MRHWLFWAWRYWQKRRAQAPRSSRPFRPTSGRSRSCGKRWRSSASRANSASLVSDTVRWYLEERFDFHAPERTTEEFLYELQGTNLLTPDQKDSLGEFLKRCDLVKFAKYEPGEPELHDLHDSAMRLVEETEPIMTTLQAVKAGEPA